MNIHHRFTALFFSILITLALCLCAYAQSVTGRISGAVKDASNAIIPGATVSVTNEATQIARAATIDEEGFYVVTNLPPGVYTVAV